MSETMTAMRAMWAACQPVRVTPEPGDVRHSGYLCRRINGAWCHLNPMAGDWYPCKPEWAAALDALEAPDAE